MTWSQRPFWFIDRAWNDANDANGAGDMGDRTGNGYGDVGGFENRSDGWGDGLWNGFNGDGVGFEDDAAFHHETFDPYAAATERFYGAGEEDFYDDLTMFKGDGVGDGSRHREGLTEEGDGNSSYTAFAVYCVPRRRP